MGFINAKNLNKAFVIFREEKGIKAFIHRYKRKLYREYPSSNCIFDNEESAKQKVNSLNANRKRNLYKYECASKHFVNTWKVSGWDTVYSIVNTPINIKQAAESKQNREDPKQRLRSVFVDRQDHFSKQIQKVTEEAQDKIINFEKSIKHIKERLEELEAFDLKKALKEYETSADRVVKILFGDNTNEQT